MVNFVGSVRALVVVALLGGLARLAHSESSDVDSSEGATIPPPPAPSARAFRVTAGPKIDGKLREPIWVNATTYSNFVRRFPHPNSTPDQQTKFAIGYDDKAIYVAIWASGDPKQVRGPLTRRDREVLSDYVFVAFDSYHDRRTGFWFALNPAGVQRDALTFDDTEIDDTWDAVWTGGSAITADGWTAEFRIPLSQLRFAQRDKPLWGLQVMRAIAVSGEEHVWSPWQRADPQIVSKFGTLAGLDGIVPSRRLELLPYVSAGAASLVVDELDPLNDSLSSRYGIGLDAKYGLSSAFTLSATVNPDFGQVEADPSQVNLTANELFFSERRPFFLEGSELFRYRLGGDGGDTLFYSRRIGASPKGSIDGEYTKIPTATRIFSAAKISGKSESGWSLGLLSALTAEERGTAVAADGERSTEIVEPLTSYSVARGRKDFRGGRSTLGMIATAVNRRLEDLALADLLPLGAYTGAVDGLHRWGKNNAWEATATVYGSHVRGRPVAIAGLQTKIRHLFQRPDASHVDFDPTRTTLSGFAATWGLANINGSPHWRYGVGGDVKSPSFEANDIGFQPGGDQIISWAFASYRNENATGGLLRYNVNGNVWGYSDFSPQLLGWGGSINGNVVTDDMWGLSGWANVDRNLWDTTALRGGNAIRVDPSYSGGLSLSSDERKKFQVELNVDTSVTPASASWRGGIGLDLQWQARSNLELALSPGLSFGENDWQYVSEVADAVGDSQYVFGRVRQVTTNLIVRLAWTLTPDLGFQLYAQPFLATGSYSDFKLADQTYAERYRDRFYQLGLGNSLITDESVTAFRTRNGPNQISFERPDFAVQELRGTLVLRWQYRPGSTVFAIWSTNRAGFDNDGRFDLTRQLQGLASAVTENVVMVKVNYWFGL